MTAVEAATIDPPRPGGAGHRSPWRFPPGWTRWASFAHLPPSIATATSHGSTASPLAKRALAIVEAGRVVATGLTIVEGDCAGLFDIVTHENARRRGLARRLVAGLLAAAWEMGARHAYLQVQQENSSARKLYAQFGFEEKYLYWYRGREADDDRR